jgi:hypothetical protein
MQQFNNDKTKHEVLKARLRQRIRQIRRSLEGRLDPLPAQSKQSK